MATQPLSFLTPEQYLEIDRAAEFRSEYLNGEMFAMSGAPARHNIIINTLGRVLYPHLKGRCQYSRPISVSWVPRQASTHTPISWSFAEKSSIPVTGRTS